MSTKLDDDTLRGSLLEQLGKSEEFESEVEAYERDPDLGSYAFLTGCLERYLSKAHDEEEPPTAHCIGVEA